MDGKTPARSLKPKVETSQELEDPPPPLKPFQEKGLAWPVRVRKSMPETLEPYSLSASVTVAVRMHEGNRV